MMPGAVVGVAVGGLLAAYISDDAVRVFIGVFTISYVLWIWIGPAQIAREAGKPGGGERRVLGRAVGLHLDHRAGRRAALPDLRAAAASCRR